MKVAANSRRMLRRRTPARASRRPRAVRGLRPKLRRLRSRASRKPRKSAVRRKTSLFVKLSSQSRIPARNTAARNPAIPEMWARYARAGQGTAIEAAIVQQYLPLVKTVVGRLAMTLPAHAATEDLYSAGLVGLLNAVRRFNPATGVLFETYARVRIRGAVFDELRRLD